MAKKTAKKIVLGESCTVEDRTPCNTEISISLAAGIARELQLPVNGKLQKIKQKGVTSDTEARKVLRTWAKEVRTSPHATQAQRNWVDSVSEFNRL